MMRKMTHPLYKRLTRSLLEEMGSGVYREGQRFLSLRTIERLWKVSEPTVTASLRKLTESGLLQASARRGYFLQNGFQQKAQILLRRNRVAPLNPPLTLRQKVRLLEKTRGGNVAVILETGFSSAETHRRILSDIPPSELLNSLRAFEREGRKHHFESHWLPYTGEPAGVKKLRAQLAAGDWQGAVVYCRSHHTILQHLLEPLIAQHLPIVVIYDDCSGLPVNSVNLNNAGLGYDGVRQLYRMGHRRIAILVRSKPLKVHATRLKGCLLAQAEACGGDARIQLLKFDPNRPVPPHVQRHFSNPEKRPTAVFACESRLLRAVAPLWKKLRISVPDDISVIMASSRRTLNGFDGPLDAMQLKIGARIGRLAARLLQRIQSGAPMEKSILLDVAYIRRGSVRRAAP